MNEQQMGFVFWAEDCIQCHACEVACKTWNQLECGVRWRRLESHFAGSYPAPKLIAASVSCLHCAEPACVASCPVKAISKRTDGAVLVDKNSCVGCRACLGVCPVGAPQFGADGLMQKCDLCAERLLPEQEPPCVKVCPTRALACRPMDLQEKTEQELLLIRLMQKN